MTRELLLEYLRVEQKLFPHDIFELLRAQVAPVVAELAIFRHRDKIRVRDENARNNILDGTSRQASTMKKEISSSTPPISNVFDRAQ